MAIPVVGSKGFAHCHSMRGGDTHPEAHGVSSVTSEKQLASQGGICSLFPGIRSHPAGLVPTPSLCGPLGFRRVRAPKFRVRQHVPVPVVLFKRKETLVEVGCIEVESCSICETASRRRMLTTCRQPGKLHAEGRVSLRYLRWAPVQLIEG